MMAAARIGVFRRVAETRRDAVGFVLDGRALTALRGDTVLVAVLTQSDRLRHGEFDDAPRAGFCLIGACQDCWMQAEDGRRIRACTTPIEDGMRLCTRARPARS